MKDEIMCASREAYLTFYEYFKYASAPHMKNEADNYDEKGKKPDVSCETYFAHYEYHKALRAKKNMLTKVQMYSLQA